MSGFEGCISTSGYYRTHHEYCKDGVCYYCSTREGQKQPPREPTAKLSDRAVAHALFARQRERDDLESLVVRAEDAEDE